MPKISYLRPQNSTGSKKGDRYTSAPQNVQESAMDLDDLMEASMSDILWMEQPRSTSSQAHSAVNSVPSPLHSKVFYRNSLKGA